MYYTHFWLIFENLINFQSIIFSKYIEQKTENTSEQSDLAKTLNEITGNLSDASDSSSSSSDSSSSSASAEPETKRKKQSPTNFRFEVKEYGNKFATACKAVRDLG